MTEPTQDRRRFPRQEYQAPLHYREAALYPGQAADLTEAGITFEADRLLAPGTALDLFLINKNVLIPGVVLDSVSVRAGRFRVGVSFDKPIPELVDVLTAAWQARHD